MDLEYDRKFEDMKKYIPFLESMIGRLESTNTGPVNPRQAQLSKIRALRDLLQDRSKRMKMENLLKCEQVLVNLYTKVEQRDTLPGIENASNRVISQQKQPPSDLEDVRRKLKTVAQSVAHADDLTEIAKPIQSEVACSPGSKEPALFQRRSNRPTSTSGIDIEMAGKEQSSKRNYTRVLVSPDRWNESESRRSAEGVLFQRRSPKKSLPKSPHKKDKRKSKKDKSSDRSRKKSGSRNLNITLKVPEDSLHSLNTEDIFDRIISCDNGDVDITTLRDLRSQILDELKTTGANEDISDLILKSYLSKSKKKDKPTDVEDGELSDSESETINNVYGSLSLVTSEKAADNIKPGETKKGTDSKKIQICLVLSNSDKEKVGSFTIESNKKFESDVTKANDCHKKDSNVHLEEMIPKPLETMNQPDNVEGNHGVTDIHKFDLNENDESDNEKHDESGLELPDERKDVGEFTIPPGSEQTEAKEPTNVTDFSNVSEKTTVESPRKENRANFYTPLGHTEKLSRVPKVETSPIKSNEISKAGETNNSEMHKNDSDNSVTIPFISEQPADKLPNKNTVSELDILQALKNEILSESISIPSSEMVTPPLHQPKLMKVANAQEIMTKRKISLEKYKEKVVGTSKPISFGAQSNKLARDSKDDVIKPSRGLTAKECERFNFLAKTALDDSSDDDDSSRSPSGGIYDNLAPRSPDDEISNESNVETPVIIPVEPLKPPATEVKGDVDMRKFPQMTLTTKMQTIEASHISEKPKVDVPRPMDPRKRVELNLCLDQKANIFGDQIAGSSPHPSLVGTPRSMTSYPQMTLNLIPGVIPNRNTNTRTFELTPSHSAFETDIASKRPHVYAPLLPTPGHEQKKKSTRWETHEVKAPLNRLPTQEIHTSHSRWDEINRNISVAKDDIERESNHDNSNHRSRDPRLYERLYERRKESYSNMDCPLTPSHYFGRGECPPTPSQSFGRPDQKPMQFARSECPSTPSHPFGRSDCPTTPSHPFGRQESISTPVHPFGRSDVPMTPSHPFGRSEYPTTPSHPFGRSDCPPTPNHPFGRSSYRNYERDESYDRGRYHRNRYESEDYPRDRYSGNYNRRYDKSHEESYHTQKGDHGTGRYDPRFIRDPSTGRTSRDVMQEDREHANNRFYKEGSRRRDYHAQYEGRSYQPINDTVSVESHHDESSFTINTSVNATFQDFDLRDNDMKFDERRKRASSLGRTLPKANIVPSFRREGSVGRSVPRERKFPEQNKTKNPFVWKRDKFARAQSVGRDLEKQRPEQSFSEIKAVFDSYKVQDLQGNRENSIESQTKPTQEETILHKQSNAETKRRNSLNDRDPRSRRDTPVSDKKYDETKDKRNEKVSDNKETYSPRRNPRDPRLRRDLQGPNKADPRSYSFERGHRGIVYTNDNITKGNVINTGYGVKNYKIPKIKRPPEEVEKELDNTTSESQSTQSKEDPNPNEVETAPTKESKKTEKVKAKSLIKQVSENNDQTSKKPNNTRKKTKETETETVRSSDRIRKNRKTIVHDESDPDEEKSLKNASETTTTHITDTKKITTLKAPPLDAPVLTASPFDANDNDSLDFSFDLQDEEIGMFATNINPDDVDVIGNINDLIADLDKDIDTAKSSDSLMVKDNEFQDILQSLTNSGSQESSEIIAAVDITKNEDHKICTDNDENKVSTNVVDTPAETLTKELDEITLDKSEESETNTTIPKPNTVITEIVSTSQVGVEHKTVETCSTPDSTINEDNITQIQSTQSHDKENESQVEMNSDISSTNTEAPKETASEATSSTANLVQKNPLDSILSILQDKSKIKELLSMLDDTDNEKMRKKLEKLSAIVSDEDEETESNIKSDKIETSSINKTTDEQNSETAVVEKITETIIETKTPTPATEIPENKSNTEDEILDKNIPADEVNSEPLSEVAEYTDESLAQDTEAVPKSHKVNSSVKGAKKVAKRVKKVKKLNKGIIKKSKPTAKAQNVEGKRITRSAVAQRGRKKHTELQKLHEDIRDMFISNEVINATGIRMCRLAKLVENKSVKTPETSPTKTDSEDRERGPVVMLQKYPQAEKDKETKPKRKKSVPKSKAKKTIELTENKTPIETSPLDPPKPQYRPGPKSKKKTIEKVDPYDFESDSISEATTRTTNSSDSEDESLASLKSFDSSSDLLVERKTKRKRGTWKQGVIKTRKSKKKGKTSSEPEAPEVKLDESNPPEVFGIANTIKIPDLNCFIDKEYCFLEKTDTYPCRLCNFEGVDIVTHYKKKHPHFEIPLSRMSPETAKEAINQSIVTNFQEINKATIKKYECRFCFSNLEQKARGKLESFFWHVVSTHTGEYKHSCSECAADKKCTFMLDIPPPPPDTSGLLMGYICGKCNYTQVSLENLKNHVSLRHNDEETEVYSVSLGAISSNMIQTFKENAAEKSSRTSRSSHNSANNQEDEKQSAGDSSSASKSINSKFRFETEAVPDLEAVVKTEPDELERDSHVYDALDETVAGPPPPAPPPPPPPPPPEPAPEDPPAAPPPQHHFRVISTESGGKEYVCCLGAAPDELHYQTPLMISLKKHVQHKHKDAAWDGFCTVCGLIVMPQGRHAYIDCLKHYIEWHMDSFPPAERAPRAAGPQRYITVRPMAQLVGAAGAAGAAGALPVIERVVSLTADPQPEDPEAELLALVRPAAPAPAPREEPQHEEVQRAAMAHKYPLVLDTMLERDKLVHVFKCGARYCSFSCDAPAAALQHASAHQRAGAARALRCVYCAADTRHNAIDLVSHVFREHGGCAFACSRCFYRACSPLLVETHARAAHGGAGAGAVLAGRAAGEAAAGQVLAPHEAVRPFVCGGGCGFRSFVSRRLARHLQRAHPAAPPACAECGESLPTAAALLAHMEAAHALQAWSCAWCARGLPDERAVLAHSAASHPARAPSAYRRDLVENTDADGSARWSVLPLVTAWGAAAAPALPVAPRAAPDCPVAEAERAAALERLLAGEEPPPRAAEPPSEPVEPPLVKTEPLEARSNVSTEVVYCLDSDDEPSPKKADRPAELASSAEEDSPAKVDRPAEEYSPAKEDRPSKENSPPKENSPAKTDDQFKVPLAQLFRCARCRNVSKSRASFTQHLKGCFGAEPVECAHCGLALAPPAAASEHYAREHGDPPTKVPRKSLGSRKRSASPAPPAPAAPAPKLRRLGPAQLHRLPVKQIFDEPIQCAECPYNTKVRQNLVRHLQQHAQRQDVALVAAVNPVPRLAASAMHFDRMLNLAASSLGARPPPAPAPAALAAPLGPAAAAAAAEPTPMPQLTAAQAARYPAAVAARARWSCGARGCTYTAPDADTLRRHWRALHAGARAFLCPHCPPGQDADASRPVAAARVLAHLRMHGDTLYACSGCRYHHHQLALVERHLQENHAGGTAHCRVVRKPGAEPPASPPAAPAAAAAPAGAPTMDLRPWQCGLCSYKNMLRSAVVEHCAKTHQSKFQYKCAFCPWRTSVLDTARRHLAHSHAGRAGDVLYYYYKEGDVPEHEDGPLWARQARRLAGGGPGAARGGPGAAAGGPVLVDINIVKTEPEEGDELSEGRLVKRFGPYGAPAGGRFRCPLCGAAEEAREAMRSHLYEELQCRRWGCPVCSYKAFHQRGLLEHARTEHRRPIEPRALAPDAAVETWVAAVLAHQQALAAPGPPDPAEPGPPSPAPGPPAAAPGPPPAEPGPPPAEPGPPAPEAPPPTPQVQEPPGETLAELERWFGPVGVSAAAAAAEGEGELLCPKCDHRAPDEAALQEHLEAELSKVRWCCSACDAKFQHYHSAQLHARTAHDGHAARAVEAERAPAARAAWRAAVLAAQRPAVPAPAPAPTAAPARDDPLLAVRYEESVPDPDAPPAARSPPRARCSDSDDDPGDDEDDDDRLVIDEGGGGMQCAVCRVSYSSKFSLYLHMFRHYGMKPLRCGHCGESGYHQGLVKHSAQAHPELPLKTVKNPLPRGPPTVPRVDGRPARRRAGAELVCLVCGDAVDGAAAHAHPPRAPALAPRGAARLPCALCAAPCAGLAALRRHVRTHEPRCEVQIETETGDAPKRTFSDAFPKRVARKSTTKLPPQRVAKKSTSRLPMLYNEETDASSEEEWSHYGRAPAAAAAAYHHVTTVMPFMNTQMEVTYKKLSELVNLTPRVVLKDAKK